MHWTVLFEIVFVALTAIGFEKCDLKRRPTHVHVINPTTTARANEKFNALRSPNLPIRATYVTPTGTIATPAAKYWSQTRNVSDRQNLCAIPSASQLLPHMFDEVNKELDCQNTKQASNYNTINVIYYRSD